MEIVTARINDTFHNLPNCEDYLSDLEIKRYKAITAPKRQKEFLVGRYVLKKELTKRLPAPIPPVHIDENGKPYIDGIHFNISHSRDILALVFSDNEIGVDVEYINLKRNIDSLINVFEKNIVDEYNKLSAYDRGLFFYKHWTQKEAYIKLTQARFYTPVSEDKTVQFHTLHPEEGYILSIASYKTC